MATQPIPIREDVNLEKIIRDQVKLGEPVDYYVLAAKTLELIPRRQRDAVLADLLLDRVRLVLNHQRNYTMTVVAIDDAQHTPGGEARGSARWQRAGASLAEKAAALRQTHVNGRRGLPLGDCTRDDLLGLITMHEQLVAGNARRASQYRRVLAAMDDAQAPLAGALTDDALVAAFSD